MREIKFRVWDISYKQFLPSEFYDIHSKTSFNSFGIMRKDWNNYSEGEYFYEYAQILEQFTGLQDKNGVDIYEGDKIINDNSATNVLKCNDSYEIDLTQSVTVKFKEGMFKAGNLSLCTYRNPKVIGNIHQK